MDMDNNPLPNGIDQESYRGATTTISTIVLHRDPLEIVVALLQSGDLYHIKVVELSPKITFLGANLDETFLLQNKHDEMFKQLQERNTPVDEFFYKVDQKMPQSSIRPEIKDAMAKSLTIVWEDLLKLIHQRKYILDIGTNFQMKIADFKSKLSALEMACKDTMIPIEIESVQEFLCKFKQLRIDVLAALMAALKDGNELLSSVRELAIKGTLDSRPDYIQVEIKMSVAQIELWLEELHDRRNSLEMAWQMRKVQLEQCLSLAIFSKELNDLEDEVTLRSSELGSVFDLGDSEAVVLQYLQKYSSLKQNAIGLRDRALKITKATEKLVSSGSFSGEEAYSNAYNVLDKCNDYLERIDQCEQLLFASKEFFAKASKALTVLDKLQSDVLAKEIPVAYTNILKDIVELTEEPLQIGYGILSDIGRSNAQVTGIEQTIEEIEHKKIYLEELCTMNKKHCNEIALSLQEFFSKYENILSWLVSIAEAFLKNHNSIGTNMQNSSEFLRLHHQLLSDLQDKGNDINHILMNISQILENIDENQRRDIDKKIESLHSHWSELKTIVENRVDLVSLFIQFLQQAEGLLSIFEYFELLQDDSPDEEKLQKLDEVWGQIKPAYTKLKLGGARFIDDLTKIADPYLETESACACVEAILNKCSSRQRDITVSWENWTTKITEQQDIEKLIEKIMMESIQIINESSKLDAQLYPVLACASDDPFQLKTFLSEKLSKVLTDIDKALSEIQLRIDSTSGLRAKDDQTRQKVQQVVDNLNSIKNKLMNIRHNYTKFIEFIQLFLDKLIETKNEIENYFRHPQTSDFEYAAFKDRTMAKFRALLAHSEEICSRIGEMEPPEIRDYDTDRIISLLEKLKIDFETKNNARQITVQKQTEIEKYFHDMNELQKNLNDIGQQLHSTKDQQTESLASVKAVAMSLEYFERTTKILEKTIESFITTSVDICTKYPDQEHKVTEEMQELKNKWNNLLSNFEQVRDRTRLETQYYTLAEKIDNAYRNHNVNLLNISNRVKSIQNYVQADELIKDIDQYITQNESIQLNDLKTLSNLSKEICGLDKTVPMYSDNISLFQSFFKLKSDIVVISEKLKMDEAQKIMAKDYEESEARNVTSGVSSGSDAKTPSPLLLPQLSNGNVKQQLLPSETSQYKETYSKISKEVTIKTCSTNEIDKISPPPLTPLTIEEMAIAPTFVKLLSNGSVEEGGSHEFKCSAAGNPLPVVQWFKNNICIDDLPSYSFCYNNGNATMQIKEACLDDQAVYSCKATNPKGMDQCSAYLSVQPKEKTQAPNFVSPLTNIVTKCGDQVKLQCTVFGTPKPDLIWKHNGRDLDRQRHFVNYNESIATLVIPKVMLQDSGKYIVKAVNKVGEISCSCNVSVVREDFASDTFDSDLASDVELTKPFVQLPLKDTCVFEGKPARLDCIIIGHPEPEVIWYHNTVPVKESQDVQLLFQGDLCSLVIREVVMDDIGEYKVVAINTAGEASSRCILSAMPLSGRISDTSKPVLEVSTSSGTPPKFEKLLSDILATEGELIELECIVAASPKPFIKWFLNNKEIIPNDNILFVQLDDGTVKLLIRKASSMDKGVYVVKAVNSLGEAKCLCNLNVKTVHPLEKQRNLQDSLQSPTFKQLFSDQVAQNESMIKFQCLVTGNPEPNITWLFNDQPIDQMKMIATAVGQYHILSVPRVTKNVVGKVCCIAENCVGKATCVAYLTLVGDIHAPTAEQSQRYIEVHNMKSSNISIKKQMFTTTHTSQVNSYENNEPRTTINGSSTSPTKSVEVYEQVDNLPPAVYQKSIVNFIKPTMSEECPKTQLSTRKHVAPRFMSPLVGKIIDQGDDVTLEAIVDGYPSPDIQITRNGNELIPSDHISIVKHLNRITIHIKDVNEKDAGRYACTAKNASGCSTSAADIVVKKSVFPPVFGHRLQVQIVKKGDRAVLDVEVSGTPDPTVTWLKNGRKIAELMSSNYLLRQSGNCYSLVIEKVQFEDAGKYTVVAVNAGGEAQSIADFAVVEPSPVEISPQGITEFKESIDNSGTLQETIMTKTKCTTESTMHMEHKTDGMDELPSKLSKPVPAKPFVKQSVVENFTSPHLSTSMFDKESTSIMKSTNESFIKRVTDSGSESDKEIKYITFENKQEKPGESPKPIISSVDQRPSDHVTSFTSYTKEVMFEKKIISSSPTNIEVPEIRPGPGIFKPKPEPAQPSMKSSFLSQFDKNLLNQENQQLQKTTFEQHSESPALIEKAKQSSGYVQWSPEMGQQSIANTVAFPTDSVLNSSISKIEKTSELTTLESELKKIISGQTVGSPWVQPKTDKSIETEPMRLTDFGHQASPISSNFSQQTIRVSSDFAQQASPFSMTTGQQTICMSSDFGQQARPTSINFSQQTTKTATDFGQQTATTCLSNFAQQTSQSLSDFATKTSPTQETIVPIALPEPIKVDKASETISQEKEFWKTKSVQHTEIPTKTFDKSVATDQPLTKSVETDIPKKDTFSEMFTTETNINKTVIIQTSPTQETIDRIALPEPIKVDKASETISQEKEFWKNKSVQHTEIPTKTFDKSVATDQPSTKSVETDIPKKDTFSEMFTTETNINKTVLIQTSPTQETIVPIALPEPIKVDKASETISQEKEFWKTKSVQSTETPTQTFDKSVATDQPSTKSVETDIPQMGIISETTTTETHINKTVTLQRKESPTLTHYQEGPIERSLELSRPIEALWEKKEKPIEIPVQNEDPPENQTFNIPMTVNKPPIPPGGKGTLIVEPLTHETDLNINFNMQQIDVPLSQQESIAQVNEDLVQIENHQIPLISQNIDKPVTLDDQHKELNYMKSDNLESRETASSVLLQQIINNFEESKNDLAYPIPVIEQIDTHKSDESAAPKDDIFNYKMDGPEDFEKNTFPVESPTLVQQVMEKLEQPTDTTKSPILQQLPDRLDEPREIFTDSESPSLIQQIIGALDGPREVFPDSEAEYITSEFEQDEEFTVPIRMVPKSTEEIENVTIQQENEPLPPMSPVEISMIVPNMSKPISDVSADETFLLLKPKTHARTEESIEASVTLRKEPNIVQHPLGYQEQRYQEDSISCKPSADGIEMEKLWTPSKPPAPEKVFDSSNYHTSKDEYIEEKISFRNLEPYIESDSDFKNDSLSESESPRKASTKETAKMFEQKIKELEYHDYNLKAPGLVRQTLPTTQPQMQKITSESPLFDIHLEPGEEPEICYARRPSGELRKSIVQSVKQTLKETLNKDGQPQALSGGIRIIPAPIKKETTDTVPSVPYKQQLPMATAKPFELPQSNEPDAIEMNVPSMVKQMYSSTSNVEKYSYTSDDAQWTAGYMPRDQSKLDKNVHQPEPPSGNQTPQTFSGYIADTEDYSSYKINKTGETPHQPPRNVSQTKKFFESQTKQSDQISSAQYSSVPPHQNIIQQHIPRKSGTPTERYFEGFTTSLEEKAYTQTDKATSHTLKDQRSSSLGREVLYPRSSSIPPSPSKFVKGEFRESNYRSEFNTKIAPIWKPSDQEAKSMYYKPISPRLTPTGRYSQQSNERRSLPPADNETYYEQLPRPPKFEPIEKLRPTVKFDNSAKSEPKPQLFRPKPVAAKSFYQQQQQHQQQHQQQTKTPITSAAPTKYYTGIAGTPQHTFNYATETSNVLQMKETTENCQRVVNMAQTRRIIKLPTPSKFTPTEYRESDYESDFESTGIRPVWTPNQSDSDRPHYYRRVMPPRQPRSTSLPRSMGSYERVLTPMEFDTKPIQMPNKIIVDVHTPKHYQKTQTLDRYASKREKTVTTRDDIDLRPSTPPEYGFMPASFINTAHHQMNEMNSKFKSQANQLFQKTVSESNKKETRKDKDETGINTDGTPQVYRDESRCSEYGTKHIDPDTGLIYFKYDFGYEFGIIFPGQGRKLIGGTNSKLHNDTKKRSFHSSTGNIDIPVRHEKTTLSDAKTMNDNQFDAKRKRLSLPIQMSETERNRINQMNAGIHPDDVGGSRGSNLAVNRIPQEPSKLPPVFITPLKDIAVVRGHTARFECIVQNVPYLTITWQKNGHEINVGGKYRIEYRNGVCRLTIDKTALDDSGTYTCTGTNNIGSKSTSSVLTVSEFNWMSGGKHLLN